MIIKQRLLSLWSWNRIPCWFPCQLHQRTIFNQTGKWEPKLNVSVKKDLEDYWKPVLQKVTNRPGKCGKCYVLSMFPYPSGRLHLGHVRVYAISDTMARYKRLQGYDVIHPMGWDAFGLPAENAALEKNLPANVWTESNIARMKEQLINMGFQFDWDREIRTCDPSYYQWTQYLFLQLLESGLVYQKEAFVNWDPVDETVLANEQVDEHGRSWRSGASVEKKLLKQWFIKTSEYGSVLLEGLKSRSNWYDVVDAQRYWIGNINGRRVNLEIWDNEMTIPVDSVSVFMEDLTSCLGAAFLSVPSDHEFWAKHTAQSGFMTRNPFTGKFIPVFMSDPIDRSVPENAFSDSEARLGVPSLSPADKDFAVFHGLPSDHIFDSNGLIAAQHVRFSGLTREKAHEKLCAEGADCVSVPTSTRLKDWLISRQRYWGTPIPIVHCSSCGAVPVPFNQLPVKLPLFDAVSAKGGSVLAKQTDWVSTPCPRCSQPAKRETDTMDTFVDSSWYYLRYLDPHNDKLPFSPEAVAAGMPVDVYIGGKEHALMHLFYARFIGYFLHKKGLLPQPEPFDQLITQGFVQGKSYKDKITGKYLTDKDVELIGGKFLAKESGHEIVEEWEKMSKSKLNGLDPDDVVAEYGVDAVRLFMMGNVAVRSHRRWDPFLFAGLINWQEYLWNIVGDFIKWNTGVVTGAPLTAEAHARFDADLVNSRNDYLKDVDYALVTSHGFNTALKKIQGLSQSLRKVPAQMMTSSVEFRNCLRQTIVMLFPFAPHFAAELWAGICSIPVVAQEIKHKPVWEMEWPKLDKYYHLDLKITLNGDLFTVIKVPPEESERLTSEDAIKLAFQDPDLCRFATALGPSDSSTFTTNSEGHMVLSLQMKDAAIKWRKFQKDEKKARKMAREKRQAANTP